MLGLLEFYDLVVELRVFWSDLGWLMSSEILCTVVTSWFGIGAPDRNLPTLGCKVPAWQGVTVLDWLGIPSGTRCWHSRRREVPFRSEFRVRWICNCLDWLLNKFRFVRVVDLSAYRQRNHQMSSSPKFDCFKGKEGTCCSSRWMLYHGDFRWRDWKWSWEVQSLRKLLVLFVTAVFVQPRSLDSALSIFERG